MPQWKTSNGQHYLKALFYEEALEPGRDYVVYTLKLYDHEGYPSIHRLYVETNDPTEYEFAKKYFDGWAHWKKIKQCTWFKPYYDAMKEELEVSIRSRALKKLRQHENSEKAGVQVNKYLLDGGWIEKDDKRGRPSKETIKREADKLFKDQEIIDEDYGRILLNVN